MRHWDRDFDVTPRGLTRARGIVELIHALADRDGGQGFVGCAAADTGAASAAELTGAASPDTAPRIGQALATTALGTITPGAGWSVNSRCTSSCRALMTARWLM